jgi:hypothetical protein
MMARTAIAAPPCRCARGWICGEHAGQPFAHDGCAGAGVRCHSPLCPYWQPLVGARQRLALDPRIQFDRGVGWREGSTRH